MVNLVVLVLDVMRRFCSEKLVPVLSHAGEQSLCNFGVAEAEIGEDGSALLAGALYE